MAVTSGFWNSVNHDRMYDALQMSQIFDGLVNDGVYMSVLKHFLVQPQSGLTVTVGGGRAWFKHIWIYNDSDIFMTMDAPDIVYNRIDAIVIKIDTNLLVRSASIEVVKGEPATDPEKPELVDANGVYYRPLAYITLHNGATAITDADIEIAVGTESTPYVTGIIETIDVDELLVQWKAQSTQIFEDWFQHLKDELDENQAAHLQSEIDTLTEEEFRHHYDLCNRNTTYTRNNEGDINGWTSEGDGINLTVTITKENDVKTYIYEIDNGTIIWTKTMIFDGTNLTETYTKGGA